MSKIVPPQAVDLPSAAATASKATPFNYAAAARSTSSSRPASGAQTPNLGSASNPSSSKAPYQAGHDAGVPGSNVLSSVKANGVSSAASRDRRTTNVNKRHNTTPSASAISFGSLAESSPRDPIQLSSSPANPPALSQRDGNPQFGGFSREEAAKAAVSSSPAVKTQPVAPTPTTAVQATPSAAPSSTLAPKAAKKKYDFNSGFTSSAPSASSSGPPSNGSVPSPGQSHRPTPSRAPGSMDASASPRPSNLSLPSSTSTNLTHLSGTSQAFTPSGTSNARGPGYPNGGGMPPPVGIPGYGWQGPPTSPHFSSTQLPTFAPNGPQATYGGPKGPGAPGFSPRTSMSAAPPGAMYGHAGGGRSSLSAASSGRGSGQGPTSPRLSHQPPPGPGAAPPGYGQPQYWTGAPGGPGGPPMYPTHPQGQSFQGPYQGYNPNQMPSYPNPHQHPHHPNAPHGHFPSPAPVAMMNSPQPHPQTLPGPASSGASTPSLAPRIPPSPIPTTTVTTPAQSGYATFGHPPPSSAASTAPISPQIPHGRAPSLSYMAAPFSPAPPTPSSAVSEFKPNPAAVSFTPRKSAAIVIKKPAEREKVSKVKEEQEAEEAATQIAEDEAKVTAEREVEEQRKQAEVAKELESKKLKEEADAAKKAADEAELLRLEAEKAAEAKRLREEEEAKEKARLEKEAAEKAEQERLDQERLEREANVKAEKEEADRVEKERLEKEQLETERLAKVARETAEAEAKAVAERQVAEQKAIAAKQAADLEESRKAEAATNAAHLPSKPINGVTLASPTSKGRPSPIEVHPPIHSRNISNDSLPSAPPSASALQSARKIEDLNQVQYPENISSPRPDLNTDAPPGKFRYDREFLLQFMNVCVEKPDQLPSLEAIGMTDVSESPGFPRSQSYSGQRRGPASGAPPLARGVSGSVALAPSATMRVGSMGNPMMAGRPPSTSEERFHRSGSMMSNMNPIGNFLPGRPAGGQMSRPPSTHSISGLTGQRERTRSNRGQTRRQASQAPPPVMNGDPVAPLQPSANSWGASRGQQLEEDSPAMVERKVKSLLNKLTLDKFESISDQVLMWANKSEKENNGLILTQVIALIFAKATDEAHWSEMYAQLCRKMMEKISSAVLDESVKDSSGNPVTGGNLFRKYLLNRCQEDYERGWSRRDELSAAAAGKAAEDLEKQAANEKVLADAAAKGEEGAKEAEILSDEYYAAQKAKRQGLGLVRFIGELFKLNMLTERIMHECIKKLLANVDDPEEEDIESLCRLMSTVGKMLDHEKASKHMHVYFSRMDTLASNPKLSSRARYMLQDIIETRANKWQVRNEAAGPKLISEIHQDAAKSAEAARHASIKGAPRMNDHLSRGGSRSGQRRDQVPVVTQDGWAHVPPHASQQQRNSKAGDLTHFGKIRELASSGRPSFGPSGIFANKGRKDGKATPERDQAVPVASNPFAALGGDNGVVEGPPASMSRRSSSAEVATASRPKLNLAPRTLPLPSQTEEKTGDDVAGSGDGAAEEDDAIDDATAQRMIKNSVDEFFHVKSVDEGLASFASLPSSRQGELVSALIEKAMDKKLVDVQNTASLFSKLSKANTIGAETFVKAFSTCVETLDDLSVDNPSAFKFCGILLVSSGLDEAAVTKLSEGMEAVDNLEEAQQRLMAAYQDSL